MVRLRLLGSPKIEEHGEPADEAVSRRHPVALLALLAAAPSRSVQRGKAAGMLWPGSSEDRARGRLNSCVYRVRQSLGKDSVLTRGEALELNPERVSSDLADFETALERGELERAVRLCRGPFLDGFNVPGAAEFEHWVDRVRSRIESRHRSALERLAEAAEGEGRPGEAARWWRERTRRDPFDARVVGRLIRVLAASGNRAEALRVADDHARRLEEELGVEPDAGIVALADAIRSGDGVGRKADAAPSRPAPVAPPGAALLHGTRPGMRAVAETSSEGEGPTRSGGRRKGLRAGLLPVLAVMGVAAVLVWHGMSGGAGGGATVPADAGPARPPAIAVLPFGTMGTAEATPFAAGLHEDLLTRLSSISDLRVVSATSVVHFDHADLPLPAMADSLGVDWVVEGGVQRSGNQIRVHAQLIDPRSDTHAWAHSYQRRLTAENLFRIQADISTAIAQALEVRLSIDERERLQRVPTGDLQAYRLYVEGRRLLDQRTASEMQRAARLFNRALERDSSFALAWAGIADVWRVIRSWGYELPADLPDGEVAARRSLELDPDLAEAHTAVAGIAMSAKDLPTAIEHLERAVVLEPSYTQARNWLAAVYLHAGRLDDALATMETTRALDLRGSLTSYGAAQLYLAAGRYQEALAAIQRAPEPDVAYPVPSVEAWILFHLDRLKEAETMLSHAEGTANRAILALVRVEQGHRAAARKLLDELEEEPDTHFWAGLVHAGLGDVEGAVGAFERVEEWDHLRDVVLRYCFPSILGPVRAEDRYEVILARVQRYWGLESTPSGG